MNCAKMVFRAELIIICKDLKGLALCCFKFLVTVKKAMFLYCNIAGDQTGWFQKGQGM